MKRFLAVIIVHLGGLLYAQNFWSAGISIGSSDHLRDYKKSSYYDYTNQELGIFVGKNYAWKSNENKRYHKFWVYQLNGSLGVYDHLIANLSQNTFSTQINTGVRLERMLLNNYNLYSNVILGFGYHSKLPQRLPDGIYFREALILGVSNKRGELGIGFQHASNANLYSLNRGYELYYLKLGIFWD